MRRRDLIGAMAACGLLAACGSEPGSSGAAGKGTNTLRYKMTVEVDTPHGIKSGYAIRELTRRRPSDSQARLIHQKCPEGLAGVA